MKKVIILTKTVTIDGTGGVFDGAEYEITKYFTTFKKAADTTGIKYNTIRNKKMPFTYAGYKFEKVVVN